MELSCDSLEALNAMAKRAVATGARALQGRWNSGQDEPTGPDTEQHANQVSPTAFASPTVDIAIVAPEIRPERSSACRRLRGSRQRLKIGVDAFKSVRSDW